MARASSRRDVLESLWGLLALSVGGCRRTDAVARERVCAHVYRPEVYLPPPLLAYDQPIASTREALRLGIPELILCTLSRSLLDLFPYLWPLTREQFQALQRELVMQWSSPFLADDLTATAFLRRLQLLRSAAPPGVHTAVVLTFSQSTVPWAFRITAACRQFKVSELLVFKDPSVAPYLCDLPGLQRGFSRPPVA